MSYNLIIVINPKLLDYNDFREIAHRMAQKTNQNINIFILSYEEKIATYPKINWQFPTLTVSLVDLKAIRNPPLRGNVFFNRQIDKLEQIEIMKKGKILVPKSEIYVPSMLYDPSIWGHFVVVKLRELAGTSQGKTAFLMRTQDLMNPSYLDEPVRSILLHDRAAIEEYIPTGRYPTFYRACTFLGQVLYVQKKTSPIEVPKLDLNSNAVMNIDGSFENPDSGLFSKRELSKELDVLDTARRVTKVFPGIPLLGIDILRHEKTGHLYVVETNCGGNTWHFSSPMARKPSYTRDISIEDRKNQFGAWDIAAQVLIEKTIYYAK